MNVAKVVIICVCVVLQCINAIVKPINIKIQVFNPHGIRVTVSSRRNITFVAFDGFYNVSNEIIAIRGYGTPITNLRRVYEDPRLKFEIDDIIQYRVFYSEKKHFDILNTTSVLLHGNLTHTETFRVDELEDYSDASKQECRPSRTILRSGTACKGQTLFKDDFDTLDTDVWQIEHYIPIDHPEAPFVSYQRLGSQPTVYVDKGMLYIQPRLQQGVSNFTSESIISGTLDLSDGCTRSPCIYHAVGDIVPPVVSGRVTSAHFAFTYGIITVRAKLPQGDWLYPEILLQPLAHKYGALNFASGVLKVAMALGNKAADLLFYTNKSVKGWPIIDVKCHETLQHFSSPAPFGEYWGDQFHNYTTIWTPESIEFAVDGITYGRFIPDEKGLRPWLFSWCDQHGSYSVLDSGSRMAPFDQHFYMTLGVAAGGIAEFPDNMWTRGTRKPWKNGKKNAKVKFWEALSQWYPTWKKSALVIDFIKVDAL